MLHFFISHAQAHVKGHHPMKMSPLK